MEEFTLTKGRFTYHLSAYHSISYDGIFCICNDIAIDKGGAKTNLILEYCHMDRKDRALILVHLTQMENRGAFEYHTPVGHSGIEASLQMTNRDQIIPAAIRGFFRLLIKAISVRTTNPIDFGIAINLDLNIWRISPEFIERTLEIPFPAYLRLAEEDATEPMIVEEPLPEEEPIEEEEQEQSSTRSLRLIGADPSAFYFMIDADGQMEVFCHRVNRGVCTIRDYPDTTYIVRRVTQDQYQLLAKDTRTGQTRPNAGLMIGMGDTIIHHPGSPIRRK